MPPAGAVLCPTNTVTESGHQIVTAVDTSKVAGLALQLTVSVAATEAGDTLNVYLQHSIDGGVSYDDFVSFPQALGTDDVPETYIAQWERDILSTDPSHTQSDAGLTAGTVIQGEVGDYWRVKWVVVSASAPSFTFELLARTRFDVRGE
jgi:hypothetical protein